MLIVVYLVLPAVVFLLLNLLFIVTVMDFEEFYFTLKVHNSYVT
jgi:hypothetical protein